VRLFVAIDIDEEIRRRIAAFIDAMRGAAPLARWQGVGNLHVTLKFLGETPIERVESVKQSLSSVAHAPVEIQFTGCGFFPNARSARVFWAGVESGDALASLASQIDDKISRLGFEREQREFHPHLTLARASLRSGQPASGDPHQPTRRSGSALGSLAQSIPKSGPEFGRMTAHEFYLYESKLSPRGAQYTKMARFPLG
jgi:2'-5' RNA ligase